MEPFKNRLNKGVASQIADAIGRNYSSFDKKSFLLNMDRDLEALELKARVDYLAKKIHSHLPFHIDKALPILVGAIKKNDLDKIGLSGFALWPLTHYVALYGLDHFELSLNALKEMTKEFTSEFAIRPFIMKDQKRVFKFLRKLLNDDNEHVRRWISEGTRPLLPWGIKLNEIALNPEITWSFLEKLKNDPSEYVRKSIANHINDHSKNHPDFVIERLLSWQKSKKLTKEIDWIIKHASRTLIKKGNQKAFKLHGVQDSKIEVLNEKILTPKICIGEPLIVSVVLKNDSNKVVRVIIDHEIHFLKANGNHSIKVFKGKKISLQAKDKIKLELSIPLKMVTTRVYYLGKQFWSIKINGKSSMKKAFQLKND